MNSIFLPELKSLEIKNFTLYPNGLDYKYDFVNGVNLIIGGNGMGKTTFVNLIRYSIIGHYKEGFDFTRTYLGKKIEKRTPLPLNYFSNRKDETILSDKRATVYLAFYVNGVQFEVERCLDRIELIDVSVNKKRIEGKVVSQLEYDRLFFDYSRENSESLKSDGYSELSRTLPFKFEKEFEHYSNMRFDDLIFFVNKILFFGEDHQTVLWNDNPDNDVQTELFNNYFNDRDLNLERQEANRQAKYYDTQARHRSEDIRVIKKVLEKVNTGGKDVNPINKLRQKIERLKSDRENLTDKIASNQETRNKLDRELKTSTNKINELSLKISQIEHEQRKISESILVNEWVTLHQSYYIYTKSINTNKICPLCSQELDDSFIKTRLTNSDKCILCSQSINKQEINKNDQNDLSKKLTSVHSEIINYQNAIYSCEDQLKKLDSEFNRYNQKLRVVNSELRKLEYALVEESNKDNQPVNNLQAFYDEIAEFELKKEQFQEMSKHFRERSQEISDKIEKEIVDNALSFSALFSGYAERFLGVQCSLTYAEINGQKRFFPVINGKTREHEEELSESQRFFVDHAFRMSILSFFYKGPSFYIVETPDSSLDISYEHNAADVFLHFLEKPYSLIITTNLNNSEFLNYLAMSAKQVSVVNLLEIGKSSPIQRNNDLLNKIYEKVQININERKNT